MARESMRDRLLSAALAVVRARGLGAATSKEIAQQAGVAVGSIYNHFGDMADLITAVLLEGAPDLSGALATLQSRVGRGTVRGNLERLAATAIAFFADFTPIVGGTFSDMALLRGIRAELIARRRDLGHAHAALAEYIAAEQRLGRIDRDKDPEVLAALLLGACNEYALLGHLSEPESLPAGGPARYASVVVRTLVGESPAAG